MNNIKPIIISILTIAVIVFTWFGKISPELFVGFVTATLTWVANSKQIENLKQENASLGEQITVLAENKRIISEDKIKEQD